ncbi:hypothetical protein SH2C18_45620 [Clostridium sediminicola]|uniref:hypothetical protein n=1 Tax=Clostridium sediminicola TaxID=3114879 RepID=UPI0031F25F74
MNIKSWLKYLIYIVIIFVMIYIRNYVIGLYTAYFQREFRINLSLLTISMLITIGIGLLLGIEYFISEIKKEGLWKLNFPKIILLGVPSLYFSITQFAVYCKNQFWQNIIGFPWLKLQINSSSYVTLFQLIFGYVIITSFYKCNKKSVN